MQRSVKYAAGAAVMAIALAVANEPARAQWGVTGFGVAEYDTNETVLLLAGVSMGPGGPGWSPRVGLQGYYLTYDRGAAGNADVWAFRPSVGLSRGFDGGALGLSVGYAFVSDDADDGDPVPPNTIVEDTDDGVVVSGQLNYWGTGGPVGAQLLASYNIGGESLWTRGRVTTRVASLSNDGQVRLGGEVAYMTSGSFSAVQPGGVLEWHRGNGLILGLGAGVKLIDQENVEEDDPFYIKAEVVLPLRR